MRSKKNLIWFVPLLMLTMISTVLAWGGGTLTVTAPASSGVVTGTYEFQVSLTGGDKASNVSIWGRALDTRNSTYFSLGDNLTTEGCTAFNASEGSCNVAIDTTVFEDSSSWSIYATANNASDGSDALTQSSAISSVVFDNTVPPSASSRTPATGTTNNDGSVTFSGNVGNGNATTGCTLVFNKGSPGKTQYAMAHSTSSTTCSITLSTMPEGDYEWSITTTDGANQTKSSSQTLTVDKPSSAGKKVWLSEQAQIVSDAEQQEKSNRTTIGLIIVAVLILVMKYGKKGKK